MKGQGIQATKLARADEKTFATSETTTMSLHSAKTVPQRGSPRRLCGSLWRKKEKVNARGAPHTHVVLFPLFIHTHMQCLTLRFMPRKKERKKED